MGFGEAITSVYAKCFKFSGRARRAEYWWFQAYLIIFVLFYLLFWYSIYLVNGDIKKNFYFIALSIAFSIVIAITYIASLACAFRRLHDISWSAWWLLLAAVIFSVVPDLVFLIVKVTNGYAHHRLIDASSEVVGLIAMIALLTLFLTRGTIGPNRFGEDPKQPKDVSALRR